MTGTLDTGHHRVLANRYRLDELIGAGGAARVYAAYDSQLGRRVAVKMLGDSAARCADPAARERFLLESRTAAAFDHPNVVTVYDAGVDGDDLFLVMEHVDGPALAEYLATHGRLPADTATALALQIADGLAAAHARGIVHRDVKPANVLVERSGRAVLTDFGIAKRLDEIENALTSDGMVVGTPAYLAPEQATAGRLTAATDVYALGVLLHEMLTGWRPQGESAATAWRQAPFDPRVRRPDVPPALADVVARATEPDPARRYPDASALRAALARVGSTAATVVVPAAVAPAIAAGSADGATATMHAADDQLATAPLPPPATRPVPPASRGPVLVLAVAAVLIAGLVVLAQRANRDDVVTTPVATTVPTTAAAPATVVAAVLAPPTTGAPPTVASVAAPSPEPEPEQPKPKDKDKDKGPGHGPGGNNGGRGRGRGGG